jgi:hypothetical protein
MVEISIRAITFQTVIQSGRTFQEGAFQLHAGRRFCTDMARYPRADANLLAMALVGYEAEKQRLETAIADLKAQLGHAQPVAHGE